MKLFKRIIGFKHWSLVLVILFAFLAGRHLLTPGYFNMHDDLQMMRQLEMEKCFLDFQIPCRWVPDMGYGFGFPLFNFYPPLPYLVGMIFRLVSFSFVDTVKLVFLLSIIVSGVGMYFLVKNIFSLYSKKNSSWAGLVSAIFYIWAPYHSVDIFVRGAMNEVWALSWFPYILLFSFKLLRNEKKKTKWIILLALSWFALLTSHNLMVLIFAPLFAAWCFLLIFLNKNLNNVWPLVKSGFLAFGLAAFFSLPAVLEQKYVQISGLIVGYYDFSAHFASLRQILISRYWGYGPSVWMEYDLMPFQIGHVHWILSLLLGTGVIYLLIKKRNKLLLLVILMFLAGWFSLFMVHLRSVFIWKALFPLRYVQFPWRFLAISTLCLSFLPGFIFLFIKGRISKILIFCLIIFLVIFNWNYFRPEKGKMGKLTDEEKFRGAAWELQQNAGIYDYLPVYAKFAPKEPMKKLVETMEGNVNAENVVLKSNSLEFDAYSQDDKGVIRIGILKFPGWKAYINGEESELYVDSEEEWGRMYLKLPAKESKVQIKLENTFVRTLSNYLSVVSWAGLFVFLLSRKKSNDKTS